MPQLNQIVLMLIQKVQFYLFYIWNKDKNLTLMLGVIFSWVLISIIVFLPSLSHVWLFVTLWTVACKASLSSTISWSLLKLMMSMRLSNLLVLCGPLLLLALLESPSQHIKVFSMSQLFASGGQRIGASTSVLPMNIQGWIFKIDWFDLLGVQGTLKSLLQHHNYSEF